MQLNTRHHRETQPLPRAIVLRKKESNRQTLGFPPFNIAEPRRVMFCTPISARCVSADGLWSTNCLVFCVWDTGAHLRASLPASLTQFHLLFTSCQRPVSRNCRFVRICGHVIEVAYLRKQPAFLLNAGVVD
jgi:hypothetical protein